MSYRKETFSLRFFNLSVEMEADMRSALPGAEVKPRRARHVLLFDLAEGMDLTRLIVAADALRLGPDQFEVIASLVTTSDNGGIELPPHILNLIRRTACSVSFSFVDVGPDDEDAHGEGTDGEGLRDFKQTLE